MDSTFLTPASRQLADQQEKNRRVKEAQDMYQTIVRNAKTSNTNIPPYDFLELIGKGAYGRVYKCRDQRTGNLVAVKISSIDDKDWEEFGQALDHEQNIRDFKKEVEALQQLKDNNVKNVNVIHDAFDLHSQLWIVADYCTGGSVRTLMRPFAIGNEAHGLPEHYIIPIARELAVALKGIHEMHIIHRDIKGANVYITEDGEIQLGDFGVVGTIEDDTIKRKTIIGTPNYMPKEMAEGWDSEVQEGYGTEVDIWAYGCTVFEMANGSPPYSNIRDGDALMEYMRHQAPPRLEDETYSSELRDLIAFCLNHDPKARPTAEEILRHPALANTGRRYPTNSLIKLVEKFKMWEHGGGSRLSLWAAAPSDPSNFRGNDDSDDGQLSESDDISEWNFSTSDDFDRRFSQQPSDENDLEYLQAPHGAGLPPSLPPIDTQGMSIAERIKKEHSELSANRGEKSLARLYDRSDPSGYKLSTPKEEPPAPPAATDLPLRTYTEDAPTRESMIDLGGAEVDETATATFNMHLEQMSENTIKPRARKALLDDDDDDDYYNRDRDEGADKRATMDWSFPTAQGPAPKRATIEWTFSTAQPALPEEPELSMDLPSPGFGDEDSPPGFQSYVKRTATEPAGHYGGISHNAGSLATSPIRDSMSSMIDLDIGLAGRTEALDNPADIVRPSTASSAVTDMTSGNPFDLEDDPIQNEIDRNRFSYHKQWQSEGGRLKRLSKNVPMHSRGSSLSSNASEVDGPTSSLNKARHPDYYTMQQSHMTYGMPQGIESSPDDTNQWPNFSGFDSFDTSPQYLPGSDMQRLGDPGFSHAQAPNLSSRSRDVSVEPDGPVVDFPVIQPPHPDALAEEADPQLLEDELLRNMEDLTLSLKGVEQALRHYSQFKNKHDEDPISDTESGFDSTRDGTEDEAGLDQYTSRRMPRKQDVRSPSRAEDNQ